MALKRFLRRGLRYLLAEKRVDNPAFAYSSINDIYGQVMDEQPEILRPPYTWAMIHAAHFASALGQERFSAVELGVAGGSGLVALEAIACRLEDLMDIKIDVHGFDSGAGLPKPRDHRDLPNLWSEGAYPMDEVELRSRLKLAHLHIGLVEDTIPEFMDSEPAPIGFIAFDLDMYSSTVQALELLRRDSRSLLPRVHCYFDDILGFTYGHHNGERLAIREFNESNSERQISEIYGLRHYLPQNVAEDAWADKFFLAHIMDHDDYGAHDGLVRSTTMSL